MVHTFFAQRVTDHGGLFADINVTVNVINVNERPTISGGQSYTVFENTARGTVLGTVLASDVDGDSVLSYNIINGNVGAAFSIDSATALLTVSWDNACDYEDIVSYNVTISVTDNVRINVISCTVRVDVNRLLMFATGCENCNTRQVFISSRCVLCCRESLVTKLRWWPHTL
jgi:hypothetical protein